MSSVVSGPVPTQIGLPKSIHVRPGWLADASADRVIQMASIAFIAVILAVALIAAFRPAPWSPSGQSGFLEETPRVGGSSISSTG